MVTVRASLLDRRGAFPAPARDRGCVALPRGPRGPTVPTLRPPRLPVLPVRRGPVPVGMTLCFPDRGWP
jgi:hypothetical protein